MLGEEQCTLKRTLSCDSQSGYILIAQGLPPSPQLSKVSSLSGSPHFYFYRMQKQRLSVLPGRLATSDKGPLRDGDRREYCRCEVTVCQPARELQAACGRGQSTVGLTCGFWKGDPCHPTRRRCCCFCGILGPLPGAS